MGFKRESNGKRKRKVTIGDLAGSLVFIEDTGGSQSLFSGHVVVVLFHFENMICFEVVRLLTKNLVLI